MIKTTVSPTLATAVVHRVSGRVDQQQAAQGAAEALRFVQQLSSERGPLDLVLDLRGKHFDNLQAHKSWSEGFGRSPALQGHVRRVAIIGDDTDAFRAEQELMNSERVRFFVDTASAEQWLASLLTLPLGVWAGGLAQVGALLLLFAVMLVWEHVAAKSRSQSSEPMAG